MGLGDIICCKLSKAHTSDMFQIFESVLLQGPEFLEILGSFKFLAKKIYLGNRSWNGHPKWDLMPG